MNATKQSSPTPEIRWLQDGDKKVLQQKHEILQYREFADGFGKTKFELYPTGRFEWVDVPTVVRENWQRQLGENQS